LEQSGRGVVIEGPSGVGKTTAVEKAVEDLKGTGLPIQRILSARNPADIDALQKLREWHNGTAIVDDFHRLDLSLQQALVDYLKELADKASKTKKIAIVGIPRTGQALANISYDIATRLDVFTLGKVKDELILHMIEKGEKALNIEFDRKAEIALAANGSLNLAQFICFNLCARAGSFKHKINRKKFLAILMLQLNVS
jgi:thymidylate kinase